MTHRRLEDCTNAKHGTQVYPVVHLPRQTDLHCFFDDPKTVRSKILARSNVYLFFSLSLSLRRDIQLTLGRFFAI